MNDKLGKDIFAGELKKPIKTTDKIEEGNYIRKTL